MSTFKCCPVIMQKFNCICRFVYTKLLAVLGKARRPQETLRTFNLMLVICC